LSKDGRIKDNGWCTTDQQDCPAGLNNSTSCYNLDDPLEILEHKPGDCPPPAMQLRKV
jgi:hypothetical protein